MSYQSQTIRMTKNATINIFRSARAMPKDKLTWAVLDEGRSVLDLLQECAQSPSWFDGILRNRGMEKFDEVDMKAALEQRNSWKTLDDCEEACLQFSENLYKTIENFPDNSLEEEIQLPFSENFVASFADICMFQYWNLVYHLGQINFIQTLYGDKDMH
jgi:hypothetical protein